MTLNTLFRIGKLHYLAERTDEAMVILGETLSKQEKLLGFDNAEVTLTRDLLNRILGERATAIKVTEDLYPSTEETEFEAPLPDFLRPKDQNTSTSPTFLEENSSVVEKPTETKTGTETKGGGFFKSLKKTLSLGTDSDSTSPE
jgi:hypothetical protein